MEVSLDSDRPRPTPFRPTRQFWVLGAAMVLALGTVLGLNLLLEGREARAALEEFQLEQGFRADAAASMAQARLESQPDASLRQVLRDLRPLEQPRFLRIFLHPPGGPWLDLQGRDTPLEGLAPGPSGTRLLGRNDAAALGLPSRMAALGRATFLDASGRTWDLAVAGTASRERDRAAMARWRLNLSFLVTGGFLVLLMRWALVIQKKELEMVQEREIQRMVRQKDQVLNQASRAATVLTLASGVAHEISTPLGVISGRTSQLANRLKEDEHGFRLAHTILEEVDRITATVRRFLDLARGGALVREDLSPASLVRAAAALVVHRFGSSQVALDLEAAEDLPRLRGDSRLLEHLLVNLLLNACDASPAGSRVELRARAERGGLVLEVADQGKGIPGELVERVLEPFFTTKGKGTGLGLALAKEIVRMHQGSLEFVPVEPQGTCVKVWLPVS